MKQVNFYFDFVSPYPWLASHQLDELRVSAGAKFCFVPVLFAALLDHHSNMGPAEIPAKRRYTIQDTQRWAVHLGLKFRSPPAHPFNPLKPLRVTSAIDDDDLKEVLPVRLLDAAWSEGRDITSDSVIGEIADGMGRSVNSTGRTTTSTKSAAFKNAGRKRRSSLNRSAIGIGACGDQQIPSRAD